MPCAKRNGPSHKLTSITLSNTTRDKVGGRLVLSIKCKGKAGAPPVAEGELENSEVHEDEVTV
ncbi:hypothetical protein GYMLUDRAFT_253646 [Collybiopsis luxurians FD-317 M1]|uniref:Uncharacterized protein n=1 Tax=Collybiopsis luxurians FD-317 M1 TaxID=944289 RepID=A0A0D0B6M6_9AGAR|nr:hypothetical protein GYMLUDRAFT_253646 [Collybiopsis luxurians FD-317 M1]